MTKKDSTLRTQQHNKTASKPLSVKAIEAMKPGCKPLIDVGENSGLRVICGKGGTKTFLYRYRSPTAIDSVGRPRLVQLKVGNFPEMSLARARVEVEQLKIKRKNGICPKTERNKVLAQKERKAKERVLKKQAQAFTITKMIDLYLQEYIEDKYINGKRVPGARKKKGQIETRRTLEVDVVQSIGHLIAHDVTRKMIVEHVMSIVRRGANVQAGSVLRELSSAYEFSIGLDKFDEGFANPALLAKASLKQAKIKLSPTKGRRVLSERELSKVLKWIPGSGFSSNQKGILFLTLWTGCRTGEVCSARWGDIDLENGTWHIRDTKNGSERYVQLSTQAIEFLKPLRLSTTKYVFCSARTQEAIQQKSLTEAKWQMKNPDMVRKHRNFREHQLWLEFENDWSPHDLRRTVRTGLSRLGCRSEVAEAIIGHSRKGIEGTYDLHSYEPECREWLQKWADYMETLL